MHSHRQQALLSRIEGKLRRRFLEVAYFRSAGHMAEYESDFPAAIDGTTRRVVQEDSRLERDFRCGCG